LNISSIRVIGFLELFYVKISIKNLYDVSRVGRILGYCKNLESGRILTETVMTCDSEALTFFHFNLRLELEVHGPVA
jgi:hypothetical protein